MCFKSAMQPSVSTIDLGAKYTCNRQKISRIEKIKWFQFHKLFHLYASLLDSYIEICTTVPCTPLSPNKVD